MIVTKPMVDVSTTQQELDRLANELSQSGDAIASHRLRILKAAVGGEPAALPEDWATTDIEKVINPDAIVEGIKARAVPGKWVRGLEWARNSLVLAPLILTWLGIWQATSAYEALLNAHPDLKDQPFLYLWQQGFGHTLPSVFILSSLALMDFTLLAIIFILTLIVAWQYSVSHTQIEKNAEQLRESLSHALGDATLCIVMAHRQRQQQPNNLADVSRYLYQFGQQFQQTSQQFLNEMAEERKRRGDLSNFTAALEKITKDMMSVADSMRQANTELTTTIREALAPIKEIPKLAMAAGQAVAQLNTMVASLGQLVADQGKWRQELQNVLSSGLGQLVAEQRRATQELHTMVDASLRQLQGAVGQQIAEQKNAAQELRNLLNTSLTQLFNEQQKRGQDLQNMLVAKLGEIADVLNTSLAQLVAEQQQLGTRLTDAVDTLEITSTELSAVVKGIENATNEQARMLTAMQAEQAAQKNLTDQMAAATVEIKNVLKSVREMGPELHGMAVDMAKFVHTLRDDVPNVLRAELLEPLKYYSNAAFKVNAGANTLEKAALSLESVTNKLDGRLGP